MVEPVNVIGTIRILSITETLSLTEILMLPLTQSDLGLG